MQDKVLLTLPACAAYKALGGSMRLLTVVGIVH
jgi:hypothetical protein